MIPLTLLNGFKLAFFVLVVPIKCQKFSWTSIKAHLSTNNCLKYCSLGENTEKGQSTWSQFTYHYRVHYQDEACMPNTHCQGGSSQMPWCMVLDPQIPQGYFCLWMGVKLLLKGGYNEACFIQPLADITPTSSTSHK